MNFCAGKLPTTPKVGLEIRMPFFRSKFNILHREIKYNSHYSFTAQTCFLLTFLLTLVLRCSRIPSVPSCCNRFNINCPPLFPSLEKPYSPKQPDARNQQRPKGTSVAARKTPLRRQYALYLAISRSITCRLLYVPNFNHLC
jgi:hypothetical protein